MTQYDDQALTLFGTQKQILIRQLTDLLSGRRTWHSRQRAEILVKNGTWNPFPHRYLITGVKRSSITQGLGFGTTSYSVAHTVSYGSGEVPNHKIEKSFLPPT